MSRSVAERWQEDQWIQTGEAIGHVFVTLTSLAILAGFRSWGFPLWEVVGGAASTIPWIILRELIDQWPIDSWGDTAIDSAEFILGGALGGLVLWAIA